MKVHFDRDKIAAAVDKQLAAFAPHLEDAGNIGVQARMLTAAVKGIQLAILDEFNRGTEIEDVIVGYASLVSNTMISFAESIAAGDRVEFFMFINEIYATIAECLSAKHLIGSVEKIPAEVVGHG